MHNHFNLSLPNIPTTKNVIISKDIILLIPNSNNTERINVSNASVFNFDNNIDITVDSYQNDLLEFLLRHRDQLQKKRNDMHILTQEYLIILYSFVISDLEIISDHTQQRTLKMNIISDKIDYIRNPEVYLRKLKLEKVIKKLRISK